MKKLKLLVPNLVAIATIPLVSLVGCNKDTPKKEEVEFSIAPTEMKEENNLKAVIDLDWTPENSIDFSSSLFHFTYTGEGSTDVSATPISEPGTKPFKIELNFNPENPPKNKITDGALEFTYKDITTGSTIATKVENIEISIPWLVNFNDVETEDMITTTSASIDLTWSSSEEADNPTLTFSDLNFKYSDGEKSASVDLGQQTTKTQLLNLTFTDPVYKSITDGILTFKYTVDDHQTEYSGEVKNININIPDPDPEHEVTFNFEPGEMITSTTASFNLTWNPAIDLEIKADSDLKFKHDSGVTVGVEKGAYEAGKQTFNLEFYDEEITAKDITDGVLTFNYVPDTDKGFKYKATIENIKITKLPFSKDTWENICWEADDEKGLEYLQERYGQDTFVGETKTIEIDGFTYEVQVIGENEDYLADEEGKPTDIPAALTFMFKTVVQTNNGGNNYSPYLINFAKDEQSVWDSNDFWQNSAAKEYLCNTFLPNLKTALGDDEDEYIKTVSKNTICDVMEGTVKSTGEQIFIPSMADIFSSDEDNFLLPVVEESDYPNQDAYIQEGRKEQSGEEIHYARYSYFNSQVTDPYSHPHPELAVYDKVGTEKNKVSYWLRSCYPKSIPQYLEDCQEWMWSTSTDEELDNKLVYLQIWKEGEPDPEYMAGLAPIFCI